MEPMVAVFRLILMALFAVSGIAKLGDRSGTREAARGLGVPTALVPAVGIMLPLVELAVVIALAFLPLAGAIGALALLAAFQVVIVRAMIRGEAPECRCFGQLSSTPVGARTLLRNFVLAIPALGILVAGTGAGIDPLTGSRSTGQLITTTIGLFVLLGVVVLWTRAVNQRPRAGHGGGLTVGSKAPEFTAVDTTGSVRSLSELCSRGRRVVLVFVHPGCGPCRGLMPQLATWQDRLSASLSISLISEGGIDENRIIADRFGLEPILVQDDVELSDLFNIVDGTPAAVSIEVDGTVGATPVSGSTAVEELVRQALHAPRVESGASGGA